MVLFRHHIPWLCVLVALQVSAIQAQVFQNAAPELGITQTNWNGTYGAAVSTADWNNDGWPDLTLGSSDGTLRSWVNDQNGGFDLVTLPWQMTSEVKAIVWIDLDNDGDDDLFVQEANGKCGLFRNDGLTFADMTNAFGLGSGLPQEFTEAAGVSFGDMDNDGDLDLHLCRYLEFPMTETPADRNVLLRNEGNFVFTNVSTSSGIDIHLRLSFQSIWWDHNGDGWQDIFVINDKNGANALFQNQGNGTFIDVAPDYNMDLVMDCMSASLGDMNQDGLQDLFHTNTHFGGDGLGSKLLVQGPSLGFEELSANHGLNFDRFCWGALWMDVDNDTDLDLFVTEHDFLSPYGENFLYENHGPEASFVFEPFGTEVYDTDYLNSHVVASADFDRNGWIDFVMHNIGNHVVRIWMNSGFDNGNQSIGIALEGTLSNRPAIGSQIDLVTESTVQSRIVHAGENYLSQENELELFGLRNQTPQEVMVHWPSGLQERFLATTHALTPMAQHVLLEGHSPCPQSEVEHVVCSSPASLNLGPEVLSPFEVHWQNETGQSMEVNNDFQWEPSMGDLVMYATWNGVTTCSVMHHMVFEPMPGDFDLNGAIGTSDVLPLLSEISCIEACASDLNEDGAVGIGDLLMLLTLVGQTCD
ncbi:MAG: hypothetical protein CMC99_04595 [Flavobacteriales bacterium]|nr:hypothetical protein [Flavobacteriales bacterium]